MKKSNLFIASILFLCTNNLLNGQATLRVANGSSIMPLYSSYWITNNNPPADAGVRLRMHAHLANQAAYIDYWKNLYFRSGATNSNTTFHISDNGFVGINGVANPNQTVWNKIPGTNAWRFGNNFRLQVFGNALANDYYTFSDSSIKENVNPIANVINLIMKMNPIEYNYKPSKLSETSMALSDSALIDSTNYKITTDIKRRYGFTAQEVKRIFPLLEEEFTENLGVVNYVGFVPLLVKGMQEQQKTIDSQKLEIAQLRQEIINWKGSSIDTVNQNASKLFQNNPNPFDGTTTISYFIDENATITTATIEVRDIMGTLKATLSLGDRSGLGQVEYDGSTLTQGYYIYTLKLNGSVKDSKMFLKEN